MRRRKRKKEPLGECRPLMRPSAANEVWPMDFMFYRTEEGRVIRRLTIVDDATHEALAIEVERAISRQGVSRVLVSNTTSCPHQHRKLAARLRRSKTQASAGRANPRPVRRTVGGEET